MKGSNRNRIVEIGHHHPTETGRWNQPFFRPSAGRVPAEPALCTRRSPWGHLMDTKNYKNYSPHNIVLSAGFCGQWRWEGEHRL